MTVLGQCDRCLRATLEHATRSAFPCREATRNATPAIVTLSLCTQLRGHKMSCHPPL